MWSYLEEKNVMMVAALLSKFIKKLLNGILEMDEFYYINYSNKTILKIYLIITDL